MKITPPFSFSPEVKAFSDDDEQFFRETYQKYCQGVYANIFKLVKSPEYAEDILQEVFVALWENREKMAQIESVASWLFVVSHNKSLSFLRSKLKSSLEFVADYNHLQPAEGSDESQESRYLEQMEILNKAINSLPGRKREVFQLCKIEGRSKQEVALLMGITPDSVKDYLKQSTKYLRNYVSAHYQEVELIILFALMLK